MSTSIHTFRYGINRVFVIRQKGTVMIDAGMPGIADKLGKDLKKEGVDPRTIELMVLTHGDFDHSGSAAAIKKLTDCEIAIHSEDRELIEKGLFNWPPGVTAWGRISRSIFKPMMQRMEVEAAQADIILTNEDFPLEEYGIDGQIVYTPGHTQGHVSVVLNNGTAFIGCLAHNIRLFRMKPNFPIYAESLEQIRSSWKKILDMGVTKVYPAHGKPFPADRIRKYLTA